MSDVAIKVRESGPYKVTGPLKLIDVDGTEYPVEGESIALCRCGHSENKPFCDGTHKKIGFTATERAADISHPL